jgi:DNA-binding NtrC family response regulator
MARRILIIEDNDYMRKFVSVALANEGAEVTSVASIEEANAILGGIEDSSGLVLVVDIFLDQDSGMEFGEAVAKRLPGVHVLLISAFTDHVIMLDPELAGRIAFLKKPFTAEELRGSIAELAG